MIGSQPPSLSAAILFGMACCAACLPAHAGELTLYVSPNGRDGWSGRLPAPNAVGNDGPFASIARARDAIRQKKAAQGGLKEPVTVQIRGGTYRLAEPITFKAEDSGTKECPIAYVAYPGEQPIFCGSRAITGWKPWRDAIQRASLPEVKAGAWYFRSLFADGRRQTRARYPNPDPADPCRKGFLYTRRGTERMGTSAMILAGDTVDYEVEVPVAGDYAVWLRYAHHMKPRGILDMGGRTSLTVDGGQPVPLMNLPDTGGGRVYQWGHAATLCLTAGKHTLRWRNDQGHGYDLDVVILSDDPAWTPRGPQWPAAAAGRHLVVVEAEDFAREDARWLSFAIADSEPLAKDQKTVFPYGPGDVNPSWAGAPDAEVHIFPTSGCRAYKEITRLAGIDAAARAVTIAGPECTTGLGLGDLYFVENLLDEFDSPGEWFLDRQAGILYYWPREESSSSVEVAAPAVERLIQFEGDEAKGQTLRHVRWSGLTFTQTDYSPDAGCKWLGVREDGVIYLRGAVGCTIENCRFTSCGKAGVLLENGRENVIAGNDVSDSAEGAIMLHHSAANTVVDNHLHHLGAVSKQVGGIVVFGQSSCDNRVAHNLVHDTARWGIYLLYPGTGNVLEYNEVFNTSLETYDTGGINAYQDDRKFLCHTVIRYNLVHDGVGYSSILGKPMFDSRGIYIDGFSSGYTITHNIIYRNSASGGIFIQGGHDIRIDNNICVDNGAPQYLHANFQENCANLQFTRNILGARDGRVDLMWIYQGGEKLTQFDENLYWHPHPTFPVVGTFAAWQARGRDTRSVLADPLFVNPAADDLGRTWHEKVPMTGDWQPLAGGIEARFGKHDWEAGYTATFIARDQLVTTIEKIEGNTLTLKDAASRTVKDAVVRHNDTVALQAAVDRAISEKKHVLVPIGNYRLSGPIIVNNAAAIVVEGQCAPDTVLDLSEGEGSCIQLAGGTDVTVRNFSMVGHMGFDESDRAGNLRTLGGTAVWGFRFKKCNALGISNTERVLVENCRARRMSAECSYSAGNSRAGDREPKSYTKAITYLRCSVVDCARNAFNNNDKAENTSVLHCRIVDVGGCTWEGASRFVRFIGNYVRNAGTIAMGNIPSRAEHLEQLGSGQHIIADNVFEGRTCYGGHPGDYIVRAKDGATQVIVRNSIFVNYNSCGIEIIPNPDPRSLPTSNCTITGNIMDMTAIGEPSRRRTAIHVGASDVIISNNQVYTRGACDTNVTAISLTEPAINLAVHDNLLRNCGAGIVSDTASSVIGEIVNPTTFVAGPGKVPMERRQSHRYRGFDLAWFRANQPDGFSVIGSFDPETLQVILQQPREIKTGDRFEVFAPSANWNLHNSVIAAVHYRGIDLRDEGLYFGFCPYSIAVEADPNAAENSAAGNMSLFDFGPPNSQYQTGAVAVDGKTEPTGFKWLRKPSSYAVVPPVHRDPDALSNDFAEITKGTTASFSVAVKPGKYRAVVGIGGCFVTCYTNRYLPLDVTVAVNRKEAYNTPHEDQDWLKKERFRFMDHDVRPGEDFYDIYRAPYLKDIAVDVDASTGTIEVEVKAGVNPVPLNYVAIYPAGDEAAAARFGRLMTQRKENFKLFWHTLEPTREMLANPLTVHEAKWRGGSPNKSFGLFVRGNPGEIVFRNSLPSRDEIGVGVEILAAPGQRQNASIGLHAFEALKSVRARLLDVPAALADAAQLQYVIQYPYARSHLHTVYVGPNHFRPAGTRDFPAGTSFFYWLTVKAPADLRPGRYEWRLEFAAENAAAVSLPVRLTVHPLRLPSLDDHAIALIEENNQAEFEFCREIGCTTAVMPFTWPSYSSFVTDDTGNVIGFNAIGGRSREWMEKWFSLYKEAGFPSQYPLVRLQAFANSRSVFRFGEFAPLTPQYFDAARFSYSQIRDIAVKFGGCKGIIADTGGEMGDDTRKPTQPVVDAAVEIYKHLTGLDGVKLSNSCNDPLTVETFFPYLQVMGVRFTKAWAMSDDMSLFGRRKYLFSCSVDGRFQNGLLSWAHGAKGNCKEWLAFHETIPFNDFLCGGEMCGGTAHSVAMEGPDGLVPTVRSEFWRDSVIDRQYIRLLDEAVAKSAGGPVRENAERFLALIRQEALKASYYPGQGNTWWNGNEPWSRIRLDVVRLVAVELASQLAGKPLADGDVPSFGLASAEKTKLNLENWKGGLRPGDHKLSQFLLADGLFYPVGTRSVLGQLTLVPSDEKDSREAATSTAKARLLSSDGKLLRDIDLGKVSLYKPNSFVISLEGLAAGAYDVEVMIGGTKFATMTVHMIPPLK